MIDELAQTVDIGSAQNHLEVGSMLRLLCLLLLVCPALAADEEPLAGTEPLTGRADFSNSMLTGIEKLLERETAQSLQTREALWRRDRSAREAYERSVEPNRVRLRRYVGVVDSRLAVRALDLLATTTTPAEVARTGACTIQAVRWPVLAGVDGEGLLLHPVGTPRASVVALPDADQTPEQIAGLTPGAAPFALRLVANGCQVLVPTLIDRRDTWSGDPRIWMTNQPHREWVYRPAFELGRHIIGYEVQKVLAAVDWFRHEGPKSRIGVAGYGEGGLVAFHAAAVDRRIDAALVSGYFDSRQQLWEEPIYRNVFGLLHEFGDAEIASLIAPRPLIVEHSPAPKIDGPPLAREGRRAWAAPGRIKTPSLTSVRSEVERARKLAPPDWVPTLVSGPADATTGPGSDDALNTFLRVLGATDGPIAPPGEMPRDARRDFTPDERQHRQLKQLIDHTQQLLDRSADARRAFWSTAKTPSVAEWEKTTASYRDYLWDEIIGRFPAPSVPANPRTRQMYDKPKWIGYEVVLDVWPDVIAWGYLLVPRDIKPGERRPVVVCQHGLEGLPADVVTDEPGSQGFAYYKAFAAKLAERGFVTFAPHNYYRGGNRFRQLQRMAYPLKKTLMGITAGQHERILDWLSSLPFVDGKRIGFYGLSYGGFSAMRLPTLLPRYAVSINSAEFNDMARKKASVRDRYSYPFYNTYEVFEFDLANRFNYADLAGLIAPRPFMVERGHRDGVAPDEWVAAEYAAVRRRYVDLGIGDRTAIEFFDGPHTIHGVGTFAFLHRHLNWPEP